MPPIGAASEAPVDRSERNGQKDVGAGRKEGRGNLLIGGLGDDGRQGMDKQEELMGIERSLWTNNAAIYEVTYSPDAILIFPEIGRIGPELALEAIRAENAAGRHWTEIGFAGVSATRIASDVELLTTRRQRAGTTRRIRRGRFAQHCTRGATKGGACYSTSRPASDWP
jgi:hypothetical protein